MNGLLFTALLIGILLSACQKSSEEMNQGPMPETKSPQLEVETEGIVLEERPLVTQSETQALVDAFLSDLVSLNHSTLESKTCGNDEASNILAPFEDELFGPKLLPIMRGLEYEFSPEGSDELHHLYEASYLGPIGEDLLSDDTAKDPDNFQSVDFQIGVNLELGEPCVDHFI